MATYAPVRPRTAPTLSPATAKALVDTFASDQSGFASSSSESPDSLYSNGSPTFADQAFEYDDYAELDADEVDARSNGEADYDDQPTPAWGSSPGWGRWPESRGWAPDTSSGSRGSIISISPRGSVSGSRKGSLPRSKLADERRESDPSLLGFDLAMQRRRSSTKSLAASLGRRRSSALSLFSTTSSVLDAAEDARLRHIVSMDALGRRFSEVVEVTCPSEDEDEAAYGSYDGRADMDRARRAISQWSPDSPASTDDDMSEIHTAPFAATPVMHCQPPVPTVLSNFPLASVAVEGLAATPSDSGSTLSSPAFFPVASRMMATPPLSPTPATLLRQRVRPSYPRAATDYQFPPRDTIVPPGAAPPRPLLHRSVSAPQVAKMAAAAASKTAADAAPITIPGAAVMGSFPIARSRPLGVSPLRAVTRRESAMSDSETPRRASLAERRISQAGRRGSLARDAIENHRRGSGERRESSDQHDSQERRGSAARRESVARGGSVDRRNSAASSGRKGSIASLNLRKFSADTRRSSAVSSRKGSVVSVSEFAYLAPSIVVETVAEEPQPMRRAPAPAGLAFLPSYTLAAASSAPGTPSTPTPRFNPMESFLGTSGLTPTSSTSALPPLSPTATDVERTPTMPHSPGSIMSRGRPISPPEFRDSFREAFPPRMRRAQSPKSLASSPLSSTTPTPTPFHAEQMVTPKIPSVGRNVSGRKPAPQLSRDELRAEAQRDVELRAQRDNDLERRFERRGAFTTSEDALLRAAPASTQPGLGIHRRTSSIETPAARAVPRVPSRQLTLPTQLDPEPVAPKLFHRHSTQLLTDDKAAKRVSVTFATQAVMRPSPARSVSTSSFSRFFHGRSRSASEIKRSSQEQSTEVKDMMRRAGGGSPSRLSFGTGHAPEVA